MDIKIDEEHCKNSLGIDIIVYKVVLDEFTIGEFRDPYWASLFVEAIKNQEKE